MANILEQINPTQWSGRIFTRNGTKTVGNFWLGTRHDCLAAHLKKFGIIYQSSETTICQAPISVKNEDHLIEFTKLNKDQQGVQLTTKL